MKPINLVLLILLIVQLAYLGYIIYQDKFKLFKKFGGLKK